MWLTMVWFSVLMWIRFLSWFNVWTDEIVTRIDIFDEKTAGVLDGSRCMSVFNVVWPCLCAFTFLALNSKLPFFFDYQWLWPQLLLPVLNFTTVVFLTHQFFTKIIYFLLPQWPTNLSNQWHMADELELVL